MKIVLNLIFLVLFVFNSAALAMERFNIVTTKEMKQMLENRATGKADFVLVNTLDEIIFNHVSIPGSINIPWSRINQMQSRLGQDKDRLIITY